MADDLDRAAQYAQKELAYRLAGVRSGANNGEKQSLAECADCGDDIPDARRLAAPGCTRCVACQTEHENGRG